MDVDADEYERVIADRDWWRAALPKGWRIYGWTERHAATVIGPDGQQMELLGAYASAQAEEVERLREALRAAGRKLAYADRESNPHDLADWARGALEDVRRALGETGGE